jgi:opacity protein-like surface antigen
MSRNRMSARGRRPVLSLALAAASACAAVALVPREAQAANYGRFDLGLDGDATALMHPDASSNNLSTLGTGFKVRFGDHFGYRNGLVLTPEVGYAFDHVFPAGNNGLDVAENMNRIFAGLRVGFGRFVMPTVYAHAGYGFQSVSVSGLNNAGTVPGSNGLTLDVGVAVEFRLATHLMIGPHAEYVYMDTTGTPQWLAFGGHIDFLF